jgi:hypothetical protein
MCEDEVDGILGCQRKQRLQACGVATRLQARYKGRGRRLSELLDAPFEPSCGLLRGGRLRAF